MAMKRATAAATMKTKKAKKHLEQKDDLRALPERVRPVRIDDTVREVKEPPPLDDRLVSTARLSKDLKLAAQRLTQGEARYLVDRYYQIQKDRMRATEQGRAAEQAAEPNALLMWNMNTTELLEANVRKVLQEWAESQRAGRWALAQVGIGPVLAAGFLAHIDIRRSTTCGKLWRFAGLDPTRKWEKGEKRPWNARLKVLCWKAGDSFVKQHNRPGAFYGQVYAARKRLEVERNEAGQFAAQAAQSLAERNFREDTATYARYQAGRLPDGRIELRARRYAVKLFLSHLHYVLHVCELGRPPVLPYVISILGHADMIEPPGWPID